MYHLIYKIILDGVHIPGSPFKIKVCTSPSSSPSSIRCFSHIISILNFQLSEQVFKYLDSEKSIKEIHPLLT